MLPGKVQPGVIFLNLEYIASFLPLEKKAFDELFVDSLYAYHKTYNPT